VPHLEAVSRTIWLEYMSLLSSIWLLYMSLLGIQSHDMTLAHVSLFLEKSFFARTIWLFRTIWLARYDPCTWLTWLVYMSLVSFIWLMYMFLLSYDSCTCLFYHMTLVHVSFILHMTRVHVSFRQSVARYDSCTCLDMTLVHDSSESLFTSHLALGLQWQLHEPVARYGPCTCLFYPPYDSYTCLLWGSWGCHCNLNAPRCLYIYTSRKGREHVSFQKPS